MYSVLGIHFGHDANAALVVDGEIIADVAEERFTRAKHSSDHPFNAIAYCLAEAGIAIGQVDEIALGGLNQAGGLEVLTGLRPPGKPDGKAAPCRAPVYRREFFVDQLPPVSFVDHHLAHASAAYYTTGDKRDMLIATLDGIGDGKSAALWRGSAGGITPLVSYGANGSIGWFYSNVTEALGWWHGDGEGKTMGLAPYGDADQCAGCLNGLFPRYRDGELVAPKHYEPFSSLIAQSGIHWHNEESVAIQRIIAVHGREHVAAEAQRILELETLRFILPWMEKEKTDILATAGGVFLNVKLNQRLWESPQVGTHYPYPNAGDSSLGLGAALHVSARRGLPLRQSLQHLYYGPGFSNAEIEAQLKERRLAYRRCDDICEDTAQLLAAGKIVGWFQGRMEAGPRALGNRSILMSPARAEHKDIINASVKFREGFRPFCPSMTVEAATQFLQNGREEPFMITSFNCPPDKQSLIPAVVHVDGTLRPQTVRQEVNPRYWTLLKRFGEISGVPVLLNTSMNIRGEPIACTPSDAIRCFADSGLDVLVLGDCLLSKDDAPGRVVS